MKQTSRSRNLIHCARKYRKPSLVHLCHQMAVTAQMWRKCPCSALTKMHIFVYYNVNKHVLFESHANRTFLTTAMKQTSSSHKLTRHARKCCKATLVYFATKWQDCMKCPICPSFYQAAGLHVGSVLSRSYKNCTFMYYLQVKFQ